jgi:hypothetical protein
MYNMYFFVDINNGYKKIKIKIEYSPKKCLFFFIILLLTTDIRNAAATDSERQKRITF